MPFQKVFCAVSFIDDEHNTVILTHSAPQKNAFLVKTTENEKSKKLIPKKRVYLELLHHRLGHRSTMSIMAGDLANIWQDFEFRVEPDPFCTSFQISRINKKVYIKYTSESQSKFQLSVHEHHIIHIFQ